MKLTFNETDGYCTKECRVQAYISNPRLNLQRMVNYKLNEYYKEHLKKVVKEMLDQSYNELVKLNPKVYIHPRKNYRVYRITVELNELKIPLGAKVKGKDDV